MEPQPISLDVFFGASDSPETFKGLVTKLDTYKCFVTNGGERERGIENNTHANNHRNRPRRHDNYGRRGGHSGGRAATAPRMRMERPRIGTRELSREDMCKKEFLSLTNKVSPQNKDVIVRKMIACMTPQFATMYCTVIWTIMQRPVQIYQHIFAEFARIMAQKTPAPEKKIFKDAWDDCWLTVTEGTAAFVNVPSIFHDAGSISDEGVFLEWSIWKKSRINLVRGCVYLCFHGVFTHPPACIFDPVICAVEMELLSKSTQNASDSADVADAAVPVAAHILDYWLDVLSMSWESQSDIQQPLAKATVEKLTKWAEHTVNLPPKCRFKVESLRETYCKPRK